MKHIATGPNELYFTLLRDLPYFNPTSNYYGIKCKSFDTSVEKTFLVCDVSSAPSSYQQFPITGSTTSESLADGVVKLMPFGTHYATIYPSSGSSLSDIDFSQELWHGMIHSAE